MAETVTISISSEVFERLQKLAVPLVDDIDSIIARLVGHWETTHKKQGDHQESARRPKVGLWHSGSGDTLPVGTPLRATSGGKAFSAVVEKDGIRFEGKLYLSLSAAGEAAKGKLGITGRAASTNGRKFWKIQNPQSGQWISISDIHLNKTIDSDALLAELMKA